MGSEHRPRLPRLLHRALLHLDPETAHGAALAALAAAQSLRFPLRRLERAFAVRDPALEQRLFGQSFPNPVGLAAGFDKDATAVRALAALGFGFLEIGTVTPLPQPGNPRPRVFRYPEAESVENALGFNSRGAAHVARRLARGRPPRLPLGINAGRNKATPAERSRDDYLHVLERLAPHADYFTLNVSSPNTPGLRDLQRPETVAGLLGDAARTTSRPLLVKLAPDLEPARAVDLAEAAVEAGAAGIILTNTTTDHRLLPGSRGVGGLSGRVLRDASRALLEAVAPAVFGRAVLVSVGGIDSAGEAYRRLRAGASLVQLYTGLVFRGPGLAAEINRGLLELLARDGVGHVGKAIGADLDRRPRAAAGGRTGAGGAG